MADDDLSKEALLQQFADAYEYIITVASEADAHGVTGTASAGGGEESWGPRQVIAHLTGWEKMAAVRVPAVAGGMSPLEFDDPAQNRVMNDAINGAFVALAGDQPLATLCALLRQTYQQNLAWLRTLDDRHFQPGAYVYERTRGIYGHCQEHGEMLTEPDAQ